ncbi:MAG: hypothetical protein ABIR54_03450 [Burkholderiaceae bacterium]
MHRRSLLACTAVVVFAHGALFGALARHPLKPRMAMPVPRHNQARLVLLGNLEIASLLAPASASAPSPDQAAAPPESPAASALGDQAPGSRATTSDGDPPSGNVGMGIYRSPKQLDGPLRTRSAPDLTIVSGLPWSGLPIRLRLLIDEHGTVVEVQILQSSEAAEVVERVRQMFLATGFTPGLEQGRPVPSYKDIEITVGNLP